MASQESPENHPHFILIPLMSPGHYIPTMDMAKLLAQHGVAVTILSTPLNALRFGPVLDRSIDAGLPITLLKLPFPSVEFGLPEGCEMFDALPSLDLLHNFYNALNSLQHPFEKYLNEANQFPSCIISDKFIPWTADTCRKFQIPRILFDGTNCFTQMCVHNLHISKIYENMSESEPFVIPGLPDRIEVTRAQLPGAFNPGSRNMTDIREKVRESETDAYGVVVNSFEELEPRYVDEYRKKKGGKVWCIGPLSLCLTDISEKAQRGNKPSINENECLNWLDSQEKSSVVYVCLGSLSRVEPEQLVELGIAIEASNQPFVWVVRAGEKTKEVEKWIIESGFEERTKGRGLVIRGWAPQVLILSHQAIGGFLTHCGWNSTLEGVSAGVPMVTWPQFAEQFFNEKLVVQILGIGVSVGAQGVVHWGEESKSGFRVKSEELKKAIETVMDRGEEGENRRKRAKEIGETANKAIEGGSSHRNLTLFVQDIIEQEKRKPSCRQSVCVNV